MGVGGGGLALQLVVQWVVAKDQQQIEREEEIRQRQAYEIDSVSPQGGGVVIE